MGLSLRKLGESILDFGSRAYDQFNVLDAGLSYKTRNVAPQQAQRSSWSQLGDVARTTRNVGVGAARDVARFPLNTGLTVTQPVTRRHSIYPGDLGRPGELIFGKEPIQTFTQTADDFSRNLINKEMSGPAAFAAGALLTVPIGPGKGKPIVKAISKEPGKAVPKAVAKTTGKKTTDLLDEQLKMVGIDATNPQVKKRILAPVYNKLDIYSKGVDKARGAVNRGLEKAQASENAITSTAAHAPRLVAGRFGMSDDTRALFDTYHATKTAAGEVSRKLRGIGDNLDEKSLVRIKRHLQEGKFSEAKYGKKPIAYKSLNAEEKAVVNQLKQVRKQHNEINYEIGYIDEGKYAKGKKGEHAARVYDLDKQKNFGASRVFDKGLSKARTDADKLSEGLLARNFDEVTSTAVRNEVVMRNRAAMELLDNLNNKGLIRNKAPNKNWVKLDGRFGKHEGKYADGQVVKELTNREVFSSHTGQSLRNLLDDYQQTALGKLDRIQKSFKTTLAPGTVVGNIASNIALFARGSHINPLTHTKNMTGAYRRLQKMQSGKFDNGVYFAQKSGLDIGKGHTGFELNGINDDALATTTKNSKNPLAVAGRSYGRIDDAHKLAMFDEFMRRGMEPELAARRTNLFSQDYNNVGRLINVFADSPVLGKPFARFAVELLRLSKNSVLYNPIGVAAGLGGVAIAANKLSQMSGESDEDRERRESQVGQTRLPGTAWVNKMAGGPNRDISLNLATPEGTPLVGESAVNIARAVGLNFPVEPGKNPDLALLEQLLPFPIPTRVDADGKTVINMPELVSSMTLKPFGEEIANRDFMGRTITDPDNTKISDKADKFIHENPDGSRQDDGKSDVGQRLTHLGMSLLPLSNEANNLFSSAKGGEDYYGKQRTKAQAALRTVGIKVDPNDQKAKDKRKSREDFFEGSKKMTSEFVNKNPDLADAYLKINNPSRDRNTKVKTDNLVSPERWSIIKSDNTNRLFEQEKKEALVSHKKDGRPLDPVYELNSPERVKEVIELRSRPTGDDIEREEILRATTDWYSKFETAERKYYTANSKFFDNLPGSELKTNPRVQAYLDIPHAEQPALVKQYFSLLAKNKDAANDMFDSTNLSAEFDKYAAARLKEINAKRAIEGHKPIDQETFNNVTFGFEKDEKKVYNKLAYSKGYAKSSRKGSARSRGGGSSRTASAGSAYKYAVSINAGGAAPKASISVKKGKAKAKAKAVAKPTVVRKKSKI